MRKKILLWVVLLLPYLGLIFVWQIHNKQIAKIENSSFIRISKEEMTLSVYNYKGKNIAKYPIACGKNMGNKEKRGDMKTPEGVFHVSDIRNASHWTHDFGDGNGEIEGAYGPYFIRLITPGHSGIGIHGTHDNNSIGTRATEGCIRLKNEDLEKLVKQVKAGDVVVIIPSKND
jgi:lipoprotein-anchoring transpeptidase ErfK/SrfK